MSTLTLTSRLPAVARFLPTGLALFISFVFIQSLFFKFSGSPETVYIFETKLDAWAASLGFAGLFAPGGIFSAKVIGSFELIAALLLLGGSLSQSLRPLQLLGAGLAVGIMSGAISFHLFTPLGIAVQNADGTLDGGALFFTAVLVWLAAVTLVIRNRDILSAYLPRLKND